MSGRCLPQRKKLGSEAAVNRKTLADNFRKHRFNLRLFGEGCVRGQGKLHYRFIRPRWIS